MGTYDIFVSYSRQNYKFVTRLINDLKNAGFNIWRDIDKLVPGTSNWDREIRSAIKASSIVILVASPDSLKSDNVHGELAIAKAYLRPIYPVWADGDMWIDCVPIDMTKYSYADCRNDNYASGVETLASNLRSALNHPNDAIKLGLPTHETITISVTQFDTGIELANHIYLNYLQEWYKPYTYGREWILGNVQTKQVAIPWNWVGKIHDAQMVGNLNEREFFRPRNQNILSDLGVRAGSYWAVWDARRLRTTALFLSSDELRDVMLSKDANIEIRRLVEQGRVEIREQIKPSLRTYRHKLVVANLFYLKDGLAIIEV